MARRERIFELFSHDGGDSAYTISLVAQGYLKAARLACSKASREHDSYLVFPAVFLYRHAVELALKSMIEAGYEEAVISDRGDVPERDPEKDEHHNLKRLVARANNVLPKEHQVPTEVMKVVNVMAGIDPTSYEFRYTRRKTRKKGDQIQITSAFNKPLSISGLRKLFDRKTTSALFFFVDYLLEGAQTMAEMSREMRAEMSDEGY